MFGRSGLRICRGKRPEQIELEGSWSLACDQSVCAGSKRVEVGIWPGLINLRNAFERMLV